MSWDAPLPEYNEIIKKKDAQIVALMKIAVAANMIRQRYILGHEPKIKEWAQLKISCKDYIEAYGDIK